MAEMQDYNFTVASRDSLISWKFSKMAYIWDLLLVTVDERSFAKRRGRSVVSEVLIDDSELHWRVRVYALGKSYASRNHVSLFLRFSTANRRTACPIVQYKFTLVNAKRECIYQCGFGFNLWKDPTPGGEDGIEKFITRDQLLNLMRKNDKISISCQLVIYTSIIDGLDKFISQPSSKVSGNFETMFDRQESGDTIIQASDGKKFRVYREILQARSPVFAAMFQHDMREKRESRVIVEDVESDVMKEMLLYIYAGRSPNLQDMACKLLPAADKYDLEELKTMSERVLAMNLTRENANDILILADLHGSNEFKEFVARFMGIECADFASAAARAEHSRRKNNRRMALLKTLFSFIFLPFIAFLLFSYRFFII